MSVSRSADKGVLVRDLKESLLRIWRDIDSDRCLWGLPVWTSDSNCRPGTTGLSAFNSDSSGTSWGLSLSKTEQVSVIDSMPLNLLPTVQYTQSV